MLKQPVWIWSMPVYFYVGGVAGVGATFGAAAQLIASHSMRSLVLRSRRVATAGGAVSAALLVHDLGRRSRFLNMLRVFSIQSPMSMGSWILSSAAGAAAVLRFGPRGFRTLANVFGCIAGVFGLGLSGYTGVLISQSAVPVWQASYRITPIPFLTSGTTATASFFELFKLNRREASAIEWFGNMGKIVELAATFALEYNVRRSDRVARPVREGFSGFPWQRAKALTISSTILSILPGNSRPKRIAAGVLGSVASLCLRFGIFYAGKAPARDSRASTERTATANSGCHQRQPTGLAG
jgi:formate-dependent nitrite reductase membrane component NrfD